MSTDFVNNVDNADNVRVNIGHDSVRQIPKAEYFQLCNSNIRSMLKNTFQTYCPTSRGL